jgi:ketosteroid isomerase-like protein
MSAQSTATPSANEAIVRSAFDAINRHDLPALRRVLHPEIVEEFAPVGVYRGPDAVAGYFRSLFEAVPDFHIVPLTVACEDDKVLVHWRGTGTFTGAAFQGVRATGSRLDLLGFDCMTFEDGLLRGNVVVYDGATFARQVGMLPRAGSLADRGVTLAFNLRTAVLDLLRRR